MCKTQLVKNLKVELEAIKQMSADTPVKEQLNLISATLATVEDLVDIAEQEIKLAS